MTHGARAARLELDRLADWHARADLATRDLSGRTPGALIRALLRTPVLSAPVAEKLTGAGRAAVQRNPGLFTRRALVREITGQDRYRIWAVKA